MKLESEENRESKRPKILESVDKQARMGNMDSPMRSNEAEVKSSCDPHCSVQAESSAMERAERIQADLSHEFPSFLKPVLKSHVSGRFCLNIPWQFLKKLPQHDCTVVLVDENGQAYQINYFVRRRTLDGGWRRFSIAHKLLEGDALVFHLIDFCKFKVYIVRALEENGSLGLPNTDSHAKPIEIDESGSDYDNSGSDVPESARFSESIVKFKDVKCFEDFKISVGDLIIDSEIPTDIRKKYYELCCSQKMFLHDHLIEGLSSKLAAVMISETINIVDAIRAASLATSLHHLKCWDKTLKGFEVLGMSVGFLRTQLHKLIRLSCESQSIIEAKKEKLAQIDEEIGTLKASVLKVKESMNSLEAEVEALEVKNEKLGFEFMELAGAI
ncbi:hypothetical protein Pfo_002666 [Paulownia fortunei]|nr:hypothetical protein Pfo_002666 [Paulownia fortunei]